MDSLLMCYLTCRSGKFLGLVGETWLKLYWWLRVFYPVPQLKIVPQTWSPLIRWGVGRPEFLSINLSPSQRFSKYASWTSSINITWNLSEMQILGLWWFWHMPNFENHCSMPSLERSVTICQGAYQSKQEIVRPLGELLDTVPWWY